MYKSPLILAGLVGLAVGGNVLWDGRFNDVQSTSELEKWSPDNRVGPYKYYIHGKLGIDYYVTLDPSFKNQADTTSAKGVKITLDSSASFYQNGSEPAERRTELIPETKASISTGKVYYHFSLASAIRYWPSYDRTNQMAFFESHFTEMTYGFKEGADGDSNQLLRWDVQGTTYWNTTWGDREWHNIAYEIDFDAGTVAFWHSLGSEDLTQKVPPVKVNGGIPTRRNWHLGLREVFRESQNSYYNVNIYYSGIYIEEGELTKTVSGPGKPVPTPARSTSGIMIPTPQPTPTPMPTPTPTPN